MNGIDLPYSFAKQRKVLKSFLNPMNPILPRFDSKVIFVDLHLSPTLTHFLSHVYYENEFYVKDTIGLCYTLKNGAKIIQLREDLVEMRDDESKMLKSDLEDIISNYFTPEETQLKELKKVIKSFYSNISPEEVIIKDIPEGWEDKVARFNYSYYFPQNVKVVPEIPEVILNNKNNVLIVDSDKINLKNFYLNYGKHKMFCFSTISEYNTTLIDMLEVLGLGYTEIFSKTRKLKNSVKTDKFIFFPGAN